MAASQGSTMQSSTRVDAVDRAVVFDPVREVNVGTTLLRLHGHPFAFHEEGHPLVGHDRHVDAHLAILVAEAVVRVLSDAGAHGKAQEADHG